MRFRTIFIALALVGAFVYFTMAPNSPLRNFDGDKIIPQLAVGRAPLRVGQAVIGVAAHNRVQIKALAALVALQEAARQQISQVVIQAFRW